MDKEQLRARLRKLKEEAKKREQQKEEIAKRLQIGKYR
jgi:hypothetical protein